MSHEKERFKDFSYCHCIPTTTFWWHLVNTENKTKKTKKTQVGIP